MREENYDYERGWSATNPGWYETSTKLLVDADVAKAEKLCDEIIRWLYKNIDMCERHARWCIQQDSLFVRFRYERDCLLFVLRWS